MRGHEDELAPQPKTAGDGLDEGGAGWSFDAVGQEPDGTH
jgi:hypothetical protein